MIRYLKEKDVAQLLPMANAVELVEELNWRSAPRSLEEFPYNGRETGILIGPAGELIEIIKPD